MAVMEIRESSSTTVNKTACHNMFILDSKSSLVSSVVSCVLQATAEFTAEPPIPAAADCQVVRALRLPKDVQQSLICVSGFTLYAAGGAASSLPLGMR